MGVADLFSRIRVNCQQCITEDITAVPQLEDLRVSFQEAVSNLPKGKLRKSLRTDFDSHLETLQRKISKKLGTQEPVPLQGDDDGLSSELSALDVRNGVRDSSSPQQPKPVFSTIGTISPLDLKKHDNLTREQKQHILGTYIRELLQRQDVEESTIIKHLKQLEELSESTDSDEESKSKFTWRHRLDSLLRLSTGLDGKTLMRVLKIIFKGVTSDVEKIVEKGKAIRAGRMSEILHRYITSCHLSKNNFLLLQEEDKKLYGDLMSALLAFYVDLRLVHASKVSEKKSEGKHLCGFVSYILKDYPEPLLEVLLQLYGPVEENKDILLPLIRKSLSADPTKNSHYLKYVLVVKIMTEKFGQDEMVDLILKTRSLRCNKDFLDWLMELCPEAHEEMPTNDKKFKGRKVTKFLLDEADEDMVTQLMDSLRDVEVNLELPNEEGDLQKVIDILTDKEEKMPLDSQLFFIDKGSSTSNVEETKVTASEKESDHRGIVLKTLEEVENMLDVPGTKPFKIKSDIIAEDVSDQEFFSSEIVSIKTMQPMSEDVDKSGVPGDNDNKIDEETRKSETVTHAENSLEENHDNIKSESDFVLLIDETEDEEIILQETESLSDKEVAVNEVSSRCDRSPYSHESDLSEEVAAKMKKKRKSSLEKREFTGEEHFDDESLERSESDSVTVSPDTSKPSNANKKNGKLSKKLKSVVVKPSKSENGKSEEVKFALSETDQSVNDDHNQYDSTLECEGSSVASSREVLIDTESFDASKSDLSRSDVFSTEGELTVVHLGESRNIIVDTTTEDETVSTSFSEDQSLINDDRNEPRKTEKKKKRSCRSECEEIITPAKGKRKKQSSKASNSSVNSQDTSQEESELDSTEKYVDGYPCKSPCSVQKAPRKFSHREDENKSETDLSDSAKTDDKEGKLEAGETAYLVKKLTSPSVNYEAKFISRALRKNTPNRSRHETELSKNSENIKEQKSEENTDMRTKDNSATESPHRLRSEKNSGEEKLVDSSESSPECVAGGEETGKKTRKLTTQKMLKVLNDVRDMADVSSTKSDSREKLEKDLSTEESESCIEIASKSESETELENKLQEISSAEKKCSLNNKTNHEKDDTKTDKDDSPFSIIDLVSECEENEDVVENNIVPNSPSNMESAVTKNIHPEPESSKIVSPKFKSPKESPRETDDNNKDAKSLFNASKDKSFTKRINQRSPDKRKSSENDGWKSPKKRKSSENYTEMDDKVSPAQKSIKIISPRQKPTIMEDSSLVKAISEEDLENESPVTIFSEFVYKTPKGKTPKKDLCKSPLNSSELAMKIIEHNHYEEQSPLKSSEEKLLTLDQKPSHKSPNEKKILEASGLGSPKSKQSSEENMKTSDIASSTLEMEKIISPRQKPAAILDMALVSGSSTDALENDRSETICSESILKSPKTKTPQKDHAGSPRKSPRLNASNMHEKRDVELSPSGTEETPLNEMHKTKTPISDVNPEIVEVPFKQSASSEKKYDLRSPRKSSENDTLDLKVPSSHRKSLNSQNIVSMGVKESVTEIDSESEVESVPNLSQHLKSPHIPVVKDNSDSAKKIPRSQEKTKSAGSESNGCSPRKQLQSSAQVDKGKQKTFNEDELQQSLDETGQEENSPLRTSIREVEENDASISKKTNDTKSCFSDIYDFHSETDLSDKEERKRQSPQKLKLDTVSEKANSRHKQSRRSMFVARKEEDMSDQHKNKARSRSISAVEEGDGAVDKSEEEELPVESPKHRATSRIEEASKQISPKEKISKQQGQKRKSVSYAGLKAADSDTEEAAVKTSTPPRRRSERKVSASTRKETVMVSTPPRRHSERKVSASTSKKPATKAVEDVRKSVRKRRLSGELSKSETESIAESDDPEVSFPKVKKAAQTKTPGTRTSKRLSTQPTTKSTSETPRAAKSLGKTQSTRKKTASESTETAESSAKPRYSLRKK